MSEYYLLQVKVDNKFNECIVITTLDIDYLQKKITVPFHKITCNVFQIIKKHCKQITFNKNDDMDSIMRKIRFINMKGLVKQYEKTAGLGRITFIQTTSYLAEIFEYYLRQELREKKFKLISISTSGTYDYNREGNIEFTIEFGEIFDEKKHKFEEDVLVDEVFIDIEIK